MPGTHALLSPSSASRWIACPPSARLEETFPENKSQAADEGTLAHKLGELIILYKLGRIKKKEFDKEVKDVKSQGLYKTEMYDYADDYATYVIEQYNEALARNKDASIFIEEVIDLTDFIPEGFGTGDAVIISDEILNLTDLKYGKGVPVSATNNSQLKVYALGAYKVFSLMFDIKKMVLTIFQPRLDSVTTFEITVEDLFKWANEVLVPKAALAFNGEGEYNPGDHCLFCRAKATCRANAEFNMELAKYEFKTEDLLTDAEIADILDRQVKFEKWISALSNYALMQAVNRGKQWPGFKLVEGRSNRKYKDEKAIIDLLITNNFDEDDYLNKKLKGLGDLKNSIGNTTFDTLITPNLIKPPGKLKLAPLSDKRPAINSLEAAIADFADEDADD